MLLRKPVTEQGGLRREGYGTRAHPLGTRPSLQNVVERFGQVMPTREFDDLLAHAGMKILDQRPAQLLPNGQTILGVLSTPMILSRLVTTLTVMLRAERAAHLAAEAVAQRKHR